MNADSVRSVFVSGACDYDKQICPRLVHNNYYAVQNQPLRQSVLFTVIFFSFLSPRICLRVSTVTEIMLFQ